MTTLQSYKGWEGRAIVAVVERLDRREDAAAVYAALTRLKRHVRGSALTGCRSDPRGAEYGLTWREATTPAPHDDTYSLFKPEWQPLVAALLEVRGVRIVPGGDVAGRGGVLSARFSETSPSALGS